MWLHTEIHFSPMKRFYLTGVYMYGTICKSLVRRVNTREVHKMGFAFVLTIVLLGAMLGMAGRQALASSEEQAMEVDTDTEPPTPHSHVM
jgi:hypothetical protein